MKRHQRRNLRFLCILVLLLLAHGTAHAQSGRILFAGRGETSWDIWSIKPDGSDLRQLTNDPGDERRPAMSPDGGELVFVNSRRNLAVLQAGRPPAKEIPLPDIGYYDQPSWLPDGSGLVFVRYQVVPADRSEILLMKRGEEDGWLPPSRLAEPPAMRLFPAVSPDGRQLAFTESFRNESGQLYEEIGLADMSGKVTRMLTDHKADSLRPAWSPDGRRLLFSSDREGNYDIWLLDTISGVSTRLTADPAYDGDPAWSPDGRAVVFVSGRSGERQLWIQEIDATEARQCTRLEGGVMDPTWIMEKNK
ncbi:MAG: hypothetical protein AB1568_09630 [Thermodesulfobacteriota bacterium]